MKNPIHLLSFFFCLFLLFSSKDDVKAQQKESIQVIAFGSCNRQDAPQPLWKPIIADQPDLWIWMGDNIYGDSPVMDTLRAKYARQNANPDYQALKSSTPIAGIWDDHDYGANDAGKEYPKKKDSKEIFLNF